MQDPSYWMSVQSLFYCFCMRGTAVVIRDQAIVVPDIQARPLHNDDTSIDLTSLLDNEYLTHIALRASNVLLD